MQESRDIPDRESVVRQPWVPYLSALDREVLAALPARTHVPLGRRGVLLSIDNYRGGLGDHPQPLPACLTAWPSSTGLAGWHALGHVAALLAAARQVGMPVIHTTGLGRAVSGLPPWRLGGGGRRESASVASAQAQEDEVRYEIVPQAAPWPGEVVIRKSSPSAFFGTSLNILLRTFEADTVIVCGATTSGCIRATVVDAASHRLRVIVPQEAVYDRYEASHAMSLFDMHEKYADTLPVAEVLDRMPMLVPATAKASAMTTEGASS